MEVCHSQYYLSNAKVEIRRVWVQRNFDHRWDGRQPAALYGHPNGCLVQVHYLQAGWNCSEVAARQRLPKGPLAQGHAEWALDNCLAARPAAGTLLHPPAHCQVVERHQVVCHQVARRRKESSCRDCRPAKDAPNQQVRPAAVLQGAAGLPILQAGPKQAELPLQNQDMHQGVRPIPACLAESAAHLALESPPKGRSLALVHHTAAVPHIHQMAQALRASEAACHA